MSSYIDYIAGRIQNIELYHGSANAFTVPNPSKGKKYRDFGVGFYLAESENDSLPIALKNSYNGTLITYDVDGDDVFRKKLVTRVFNCYDHDWAAYVFMNRMFGDVIDDVDIVIGPTAGGHVLDLFERWRKENIAFSEQVEKELIREASDTTFGIQWCFKTENAISILHEIEREDITR